VPESSVPLPGRPPSNNADDADDPSVVEESVKLEEEMDAAYDDVEEAETWSPDCCGLGLECDVELGGLASTENRTGSSLR